MSDAAGDWVFASGPTGPVDVPSAVAYAARGATVECVWVNSVGGLTFEVLGHRRFVKWAPADGPQRLLDEADRMRWASPYTPVPEVLDCGVADDGSTWLLTAALPGTLAVADRWKAEPRVAVRAIGEGLRAFHEALPATACPFEWSADARVTQMHARAGSGLIDPAKWHPSHRHLSLDDAITIAADPPPVDALVVCHADACAPNTLIDDEGRWTGHVDLECTGTADRWADLAIATWSTTWYYGPGWESELLAAYGVGNDGERTRYYRLLWDLTG